MLIKVTFCALILTLFAASSFAQTNDEYKKNEFSAGFSHSRADSIDNYNGFEASAVRNVSRYFGIKGDFSAGFRKQSFTANVGSGSTTTPVNFHTGSQIHNFLGGVQVKDNATKSRFKPFAHALVGVGYGRFSTKSDTCLPNATACNVNSVQSNETGFAGAFGGGLDVRVSNKIDVRAIQIDYNPIYFANGFRNNVRFGVGIVFH